jgi:hypothetical protein
LTCHSATPGGESVLSVLMMNQSKQLQRIGVLWAHGEYPPVKVFRLSQLPRLMVAHGLLQQRIGVNVALLRRGAFRQAAAFLVLLPAAARARVVAPRAHAVLRE